MITRKRYSTIEQEDIKRPLHFKFRQTMDLDDVFQLLETAKGLEKSGHRIEAATKYYESCYLMRQISARFPQNEQSSPTYRLLQENIETYTQAAQNLYFDDASVAPTKRPATVVIPNHLSPEGLDDVSVLTHPAMTHPVMTMPVTPRKQNHPATCDSPRFTQSAEINRLAGLANASLKQAIDFDEKNQTEDAIQSYMGAAENYLAAIKLATQSSSSSSITEVMTRRLTSAMDRIEALKNPIANRQLIRQQHDTRESTTPTDVSNHESSSSSSSSSAPSYSKAEIAVLKHSSLIASGLFLPFSEDEARSLSRQVALQKPNSSNDHAWNDPDGYLRLSEKQKKRFYRWARPHEIVQERSQRGVKQRPLVMISQINPYTIRQQYVTDCSFIASLCICALFEKRFRKRLITSIIYPQDKNGMPIYNPAGKYMVKLWLNGVARCVVVDDRLPIDRYSNLLCSQTSGDRSQLELFCSIVEKAYMKLCGGYDFPGSNSGVDLFSLTGWIPERIFFPSGQGRGGIRDFETPPDRAWERLFSAYSFGDCLITVSTSRDIAEKEADALGLVTGHAYAVLDVVQSLSGLKLLQLKNPWACKGWTGKFSPHDKTSWRDRSLRSELKYDPVEAAKHDDGVFWISWDDVLLYFRNLQLSWNPKLFSYRFTTHGMWPVKQGPEIDVFNIGENPQYIMVLSDKTVLKKPTIWILISRHVSKQEQEGADIDDFLTIHLLRNSAKFERLWYPNSKSTISNGCYTNNPHVLLRHDVKGPEDQFISLVLSQHQKKKDLAYTLSCYCTEPFTLSRPPKMLPCKLNFASEWTAQSAGGAFGSTNFFLNPMFEISLTRKTTMQIRCTAPSRFAVNIMLLGILDNKNAGNKRNLRELVKYSKKPVLDSGNYRHGFTVTEMKSINPGTYVLIASTYDKDQIGKFIVKMDTSIDVASNQIA
mmetsp:Transcript_457/g.1167  ORF Transcript_457/g.1167 Transcript_457/m.1167 type:complete len:935 (-) Transcript_457:685-3489(-)